VNDYRAVIEPYYSENDYRAVIGNAFRMRGKKKDATEAALT
jgi:hypothetical protein